MSRSSSSVGPADSELEQNIASTTGTSSQAVSRWAEPPGAPASLVGDFNLPGDSFIFRRYWSVYRGRLFDHAGLGFGHTW